jgi:hypothetical protein
MILGPDGNLWFTHGNSIDRLKVDGTITEYPVPTAGGNPSALVIGGDGNLWFTEYVGKKLGQLIVSSATDAGAATINESDAVLAAGAVEIVPVGGRGGTAASSRQALGFVRPDDDPCLGQKFVVRFTIEGFWYEIDMTGDSAARCADIKVVSYIVGSAAAGRDGRQPVVMDCYVINLGPSSADNVVAQCIPFGGKIDFAAGRKEGPCNFVPTAGGDLMITTGSLAKGDHCEFSSGYVQNFAGVPNYALSINGHSDTFDPYMPNNGNVTVWDPDENKVTMKWFFNPDEPLKNPPNQRGH